MKKLKVTLIGVHKIMCDLVEEKHHSTFYWLNIFSIKDVGAIARRALFWFIIGEFRLKNGVITFGRNYS